MIKMELVLELEDPLSIWPQGLHEDTHAILQDGLNHYLNHINQSHHLCDKDSIQIDVYLADDEALQALNRQWRNMDKPTNILSFGNRFDVNHGNFLLPFPLGNLALSWQRLQDEAKREGKKIEHHYTHLLIHGLLHLLGEDHEEETQAEQMEQAEITILATRNIPNPYSSH